MHVLVIGGGMAGLSAAVVLRKSMPDLHITLAEPKAYIEIPWAAIRALFDRAVADANLMDLAAWATKHGVTHVRSTILSLSLVSAKLATGETIPFDVCLVATGARTKIPALGRELVGEGTLSERREMHVREGKQLLEASSVLIIGGGAIGTELAGDLAAYAKQQDKNVAITLVHAGEHLVPELNPAGAAKVKTKLEKLGVRVVLNERAVEENGAWTLGKSGERLEAERVLEAVGIQPSTAFFKQGLLAACLDEAGWVKVDDYFRVHASDGKIFAVGDCCTALTNTAPNAFNNKKVVAGNIISTLKAIEEKEPLDALNAKMKRKRPAPSVFVVTTGPKSGVARTAIGNDYVLLPALKNKTMLTFKAKSEIGV
ncbi:unnamed protein product [Chondrus crispus]|uniref:FAD/NAD(P)-binding domain-containing protein n=1 Tax=Chondrus crispus TaxID=2769 RepID=S0F2V2_CHOCR|nr:unnamed protein product [Chondrus crispus]CDF77461.1 unnamed protein product [Chondrus crispus]|eukprot:XP_005712335.1 unnamed protein product [Chondrus crispus]